MQESHNKTKKILKKKEAVLMDDLKQIVKIVMNV